MAVEIAGHYFLLRRWNYDKREYEPFQVPSTWSIPLLCEDMGQIINCANCGTRKTFGECYTSQEIHTQTGMGFNVCESCHEKECALRSKKERIR